MCHCNNLLHLQCWRSFFLNLWFSGIVVSLLKPEACGCVSQQSGPYWLSELSLVTDATPEWLIDSGVKSKSVRFTYVWLWETKTQNIESHDPKQFIKFGFLSCEVRVTTNSKMIAVFLPSVLCFDHLLFVFQTCEQQNKVISPSNGETEPVEILPSSYFLNK